MGSQASQRATGLAHVIVFKREFACWTKQFPTGGGRVRTGRDNYFMACTGREKIKVFEMNQTLLPQCRPCTGTCYPLNAKDETCATERYVVPEFRRPLCPCALYVSTSLFAYGTKTLRKPKQASSLGNECKSCTVNIDELVSCKTSHRFVPFRI